MIKKFLDWKIFVHWAFFVASQKLIPIIGTILRKKSIAYMCSSYAVILALPAIWRCPKIAVLLHYLLHYLLLLCPNKDEIVRVIQEYQRSWTKSSSSYKSDSSCIQWLRLLQRLFIWRNWKLVIAIKYSQHVQKASVFSYGIRDIIRNQ